MLTIRPCKMTDLDQLMEISQAVGKGMTSMPECEQAWQEKIQDTETAFSPQALNRHSNTYFMILEDSETGRVAGTTAIYTGIGLNKPFYSYKLSTLVSSSSDLATTRQAKVLSMVNDYTGATEIGSLFLLPEFRKPGVGQFLSRSRYLALADFPDYFGDIVMAELRGWQNKEGHSPLWDHLASKFLGIEFQDAVNTVALKGTQFISDLMPKYPIYVDLLPEEAREVIGKPHDSSAPALNMLKKEGFQYSGYVDLFDGGPSVQAARDEIHTVRDSLQMQCLPSEQVTEQDELYMVSNGILGDYRVTLCHGRVTADNQLLLAESSFNALQISSNSIVRCIPFKRAQASVSRAA